MMIMLIYFLLIVSVWGTEIFGICQVGCASDCQCVNFFAECDTSVHSYGECHLTGIVK